MDLPTLIHTAARDAGCLLLPGDVAVIAQKIVSKAEGRKIALCDVMPSPRARQVAEECGKDPRIVELILSESTEVVRCKPGLLITRHRLGYVVANAAIDQSNVADGDAHALLLPCDPDASAMHLSKAISAIVGGEIGVIINDSFGRPFRSGTCGVAIGCAGVESLIDQRGQPDRHGRILQATLIAHADEIAAAASIVMGQAGEGLPAVIVRGLPRTPSRPAADLVRPAEQDLFR